MKFFGPAHPIEIQELLANDRILIKQLIEFAQFEKEDFLVIVLF